MINSLFNINNYFLNPHAITYFASGILIGAESIFILLQNRKSLVNFSFFLCTIFAGVWLTGVGFIYSSSTQTLGLLWSRYSWLGIVFVTPSVYFLSSVWSGALTKRKSGIIIFNFFTAFLIYIVCLFSNYIIKGLWHYSWGFYPVAGIAQLPFMVWFYVLMSLSFRNFIVIYRNEESGLKRKHTLLVIIAFIFGFLGSLDFVANFGIPFYTFAAVSVLLFSTTVAYAIVHYRMMDIETVIHKTIAWFFTSIALIAPLAVLLYFTRGWYVRLRPFESGAYFGVVLLCFLFFVKAFQPKIDHFFKRRQANLEAISNRFTEELVHLRGLSQLIQNIEATIAETLYPQKINIFIFNQKNRVYALANAKSIPNENNIDLSEDNHFLQWLLKNNRIVYKDFIDFDPQYSAVKEEARNYFNLTKASVAVPLVLNERLLGVIDLAKKSNLKRYTAMDFHFLTILKNQATIAISNSLLYENMEGQVKQRTEELMQVQKQLVQAEKLATVGTLAGGVAHEINNPLTAILTNAQMLLAVGNALDTDSKESLELIEEATKRCRTIVQKLMTYAKKPLEAADMHKINLLDAVTKAISFLEYQLGQDNIKITLHAKEKEYPVLANFNEMEQVATNLILNARDAIKHVKKEGEIEIGLSKAGDLIKFSVKDNGSGIPKEIIPKIFDPFFTTKDVGKGTGLGLSICHSILEKHNGVISVDSQLGKGSTFTIQLPRAKVGTVPVKAKS